MASVPKQQFGEKNESFKNKNRDKIEALVDGFY